MNLLVPVIVWSAGIVAALSFAAPWACLLWMEKH